MKDAIDKLLSDKQYREKLCENVKKFAVKDANERIYKEVMRIAGKKNERR
jgi:UDP-N-acetylglucosamine:LPS N-acetylglucosamine transferase